MDFILGLALWIFIIAWVVKTFNKNYPKRQVMSSLTKLIKKNLLMPVVEIIRLEELVNGTELVQVSI